MLVTSENEITRKDISNLYYVGIMPSLKEENTHVLIQAHTYIESLTRQFTKVKRVKLPMNKYLFYVAHTGCKALF